MFHEIPLITSGSQKCRGAAPIFIRRAEFSIVAIMFGLSNKFEVLRLAIKMIEKIRIAEAIAWVIKYFRVASAENLFLNDFIRGISESRLISNPNQAVNHEVAEIEIIVPIINLKEKRSL